MEIEKLIPALDKMYLNIQIQLQKNNNFTVCSSFEFETGDGMVYVQYDNEKTRTGLNISIGVLHSLEYKKHGGMQYLNFSTDGHLVIKFRNNETFSCDDYKNMYNEDYMFQQSLMYDFGTTSTEFWKEAFGMCSKITQLIDEYYYKGWYNEIQH